MQSHNLTWNARSGSLTHDGTHRFLGDLSREWVISKLAQDETGKRQHYRPIYSIHKWWARRPGTLFRSILLLATKPHLRDNLFLLDSRGNLLPQSAYLADHDLSDWIILDPFMGGGTTLVEANRMGAKVIGCDLNPVAYWIVRESLKPVDIDKLIAYFHQLERTAGEQIKALYRTYCIHCKRMADTLHAFWIRTVPCLRCGQQVLLYKRTLLNEGQSRNKPLSPNNPATVFCPSCSAIFLWDSKQPAVCPNCQHRFDPYQSTYNQGLYSCPHCGGDSLSLLETLRRGAKLSETLVAIEYWCASCQTRLYKTPDQHDRELLDTICAEYHAKKDSLLIPHQPIPLGSSSRRWIQHGYTHYRDVFNPRQLLAFNYLISGIQQIEEPEYRYCFYTIFSNMLEYNNMMVPYNYPNRKLHHLFNYHALPLTTTPVENAVWGADEEGAGTFVNCFKRYVNAKHFCSAPFERYKNAEGQVVTIPLQKEHISATFVDSYAKLLSTSRGALLLCQDSAHLPQLPDKSVDLVITDPPYYDSIHYSELSNFFYVWLSLLIQHPPMSGELVPTEHEAIVNKGMGKGEEEYITLLRSVFRECHRVLKDEGRLIFTFHHTNWRAWWAIFQVVLNSGFRIIDYFPVQSEYRVNPHIRDKRALDADLVLICQKRTDRNEIKVGSPAEAFQRAAQAVGQYYPKGASSLLFLHYVGELLRSASAMADTQTPSYEWFQEALNQFETLVSSGAQSQKVESHSKSDLQLTLFE